MDAKLLQRVMDLADKTGDRVIVVNPKNNTAHALVPFDDYEKMASGTISLRDFDDIEKADIDDDVCGLEEIDGLNLDDLKDTTDDDVEDNLKIDRIEPISGPVMTDEEIEKAVERDLAIMKAAEISEKEADKPSPLDVLDDEANEDQYYLEPIE